MTTSTLIAGLRKPFSNGLFHVLLLAIFVAAIAAVQTVSYLRSSSSIAVQTILLSEVRLVTLVPLTSTDAAFGVSPRVADEGGFNPPFATVEEETLFSDLLEEQLADAAQSDFAEAQGIELSDGQRILSLDFDLSADAPRSGNLEVDKPVYLAGNLVGTVNVAIDQYSALHIAAADLEGILPSTYLDRLPLDEGYVAFDQLRNAGVGINYDPVGDALEIEL